MRIRIAYIEEPPFYWTAEDGAVTGADIELADAVLRAIGAAAIEYVPTSFDEFLPGVQERRWDMNVPIFVTPERARQVTFSQPVWALGDGFLVQPGNPKVLTGYPALAARREARLGVIAGQVQVASANAAGVGDGQLIVFRNQPEAIAALMDGKIDAFAATAIGCRAAADGNPAVEAVAHEARPRAKPPRRCLLVRQGERGPVERREPAIAQLSWFGRAPPRMAKYGITRAEIDAVLTKA
jgi:polar amino acid transport system substrate-binding protein